MSHSEIQQSNLNDFTRIFKPCGSLDNNNAHEMVDLISSAQAEDFKFIIIDLADLEFISSAGVGSILGTVESSREIGGDIILCNASQSVLHVFAVLDLTDYLTFRSDEKEAADVCQA